MPSQDAHAEMQMTWDPTAILRPGFGANAPYAVVLLNQAIPEHQIDLFRTLWSNGQSKMRFR